MIKKIIFKIISFFKIPLNYKGLRIETTSSLKKIYGTDKRNKTKIISKANKRYILCLGDSNTFGWNYLFKDSYPEILKNNLKSTELSDIDVLNFGKGGTGIEDLYINIRKYMKIPGIFAIILNYGLNDVFLDKIYKNYLGKNKSNNYYNSYNIAELKFKISNLKEKYSEVIKEISMSHIKVIIIGLYKIKKTRIFNKWVSDKKNIEFQNQLLDYLNDAIKNTALNNNADFIDIWNIFDTDFSNSDYLQKDGFHLNKKGFELIAERISNFLLNK